MDGRTPYQTWLRVTGFLASTLVWAAMYLELVTPLKECPFQHLRIWVISYLLSSAGMWGLSEPWARTCSLGRWLPLMMLTTLPVLAMAYLWPSSLTGLLLVFPAWLVGQRLGLGPTALWVGLHTAIVGYIMKCVLPWPKMTLLMLIYGTLQAFAVLIARMARSERESRQDLSRTLGELRATQELLASSTRAAERLHLARELHDVMGHHLSAASLHLEAAARQAEGPVREGVATAQQQVRALLQELRSLVSNMRTEEPLDLAATLQALTEGIETPRIHLAVLSDVELSDAGKAHILLRCAQELITNALKHAQAQNLWLTLESHAEGLMLRIEDDGRGAPQLQEGHGLQGMRERLAGVGGQLELTTNLRGLRASVWIPAHP